MSKIREWINDLGFRWWIRISLWMKHILVRAQYNYLNKLDRYEKQIRGMNYGYVDSDPAAPRIALSPEEEPSRYAIQLYDFIAKQVELTGKDVLEVGCGRGGGAAYVARTFKPRKYIGIDLFALTIEFCVGEYHVEGLSFQRGNAEDLEWDEATFDVVLNVESSHLYDYIDHFLLEVHRVLRPGGTLLLADFRNAEMAQILRNEIAEAGLELVREVKLNENVVASLDLDHDRKAKLIEERLPKRWRAQYTVFAALKGSVIYDHIKSGELEYFLMIARKPQG